MIGRTSSKLIYVDKALIAHRHLFELFCASYTQKCGRCVARRWHCGGVERWWRGAGLADSGVGAGFFEWR